jgi:hypothetical protein
MAPEGAGQLGQPGLGVSLSLPACAWCAPGPSLLQSLHMQKNNVDLMRTKLRRLEEENSRKDRQIEQLLDPGQVSSCPRPRPQTPDPVWRGRASRPTRSAPLTLQGSEFVRTLAEKRPDTGWVSSRHPRASHRVAARQTAVAMHWRGWAQSHLHPRSTGPWVTAVLQDPSGRKTG